MTQKHSALTLTRIWKLTLVATACFLTLNLYAVPTNSEDSYPTLREHINSRNYEIRNSPNGEDFCVDWFPEPENANSSPQNGPTHAKATPLNGEDNTFFPIDESEGRIPSSRLPSLVESDLGERAATTVKERESLGDWAVQEEEVDLAPPASSKDMQADLEKYLESVQGPNGKNPKSGTETEASKESGQLRRRPTFTGEDTTAPSPIHSQISSKPATTAATHPGNPGTGPQGLDILNPDLTQEGYENEISEREQQPILVNFNNVSIIEVIRFVSRSTGKNFVFDENELTFNVSIISEEPTSVANIMTALMQELRIHGLMMMEEGNNVIIYSNNNVQGISKVVDQNGLSFDHGDSEIVTQVFRLNTTPASAAAAIVKPLTSETAVVDVLDASNHLIVTDLTSNVRKVSQLLKNLDSPKSGLVVGQYVVKNDYVDSLTENAKGIMGPLTGDQSLTMVPHTPTNSIFIVGSPYLVEKSIQVMRYLDQNESSTRLLDQNGRWVLDDNGQWIFRTDSNGNQPPDGGWYVDEDGNWIFKPGQPGSGKEPNGAWELDENGNWVYRLKPGQSIAARKLNRPENERADNLPFGHIEKAQFTIYKLKYRPGDQVAAALQNIGQSLQDASALNQDFINSINTVQWIESSNSLIFTGTPTALGKVIEFIHEIDVPLRQVFIEMLIMDMTLADSLIYGVNWGTQLGGGTSVALGESFVSGVSQINTMLTNSAGANTPTVAGLAAIPGYRLGVIGKHLSKGGIQFDTIAALVKASHTDEDTRILMNPKIFTEENYPAEVFVGLEVQYPTQSIANDFGSVITQNYESKDIGTKLQVTPIIGNNDVITIDIHQEVSDIAGAATQLVTQPTSTAGPTITKSTTTTRVHVPNGFFVAISGEIRDDVIRHHENVPCLGSIPFIGEFFSEQQNTKTKRNLMIFMRPQIIDTAEQFDTLAHHQQDVWQNASYSKKRWEYEVEEALDLMNLKKINYQRYDKCDYTP